MISKKALVNSILGVFILSMCSGAIIPEGATTALEFTSRVKYGDYIVSDVRSILPRSENENILIFNGGKTEILLHILVASSYNLKFGYLRGGMFGNIKIFINDQLLWNDKNIKKPETPEPAVAEFKTPKLYATFNNLRIESDTEKIGLLYWQKEILDYTIVPGKMMKAAWISGDHDFLHTNFDFEKQNETGYPEETLNGKVKLNWSEINSAAVSEDGWIHLKKKSDIVLIAVHFFRTGTYSRYAFRLTADCPARLNVRGSDIIRYQTPGKPESNLLPYLGGYGLSRTLLVLKPEKDFSFKLEITPLSGNHFMNTLPDHMSASGNKDNYPAAKISNDRITAVIPLPDPQTGYYRGTRFEHFGSITSMTIDGNQFFKEFGPLPHNPNERDAVAGPVGEFIEPLGYDDAAEGDHFIKIAVGVFEKPFEKNCHSGSDYWIVKTFDCRTQKYNDCISFEQNSPNINGWAYKYKKTISLPDGKTVLKIENELLNTGTKRLRTSYYAHNFINLGNSTRSAEYEIEFPFVPGIISKDNLKIPINGKKLVITENCSFLLKGFNNADDNWVKIKNISTPLVLKCQWDFPLYYLQLYYDYTAVCPEPCIHIDIAPGESKKWNFTYLPSI